MSLTMGLEAGLELTCREHMVAGCLVSAASSLNCLQCAELAADRRRVRRPSIDEIRETASVILL